jgi:hypothetical protein
MCDRWLHSFENFLADMGKAPEGYSLERKDNNAHYCPDNCTWIPQPHQSKNKRTSKRVEWSGRTLIVSDWESKLRITRGFLSGRLKRGMPLPIAMEAARLASISNTRQYRKRIGTAPSAPLSNQLIEHQEGATQRPK